MPLHPSSIPKPSATSRHTEEVERLIQAIRLGATYKNACNFAGMNFGTFRRWMEKGEKEASGKWHEFFCAVRKAEGEALVNWLALVEKAARDGDWKAAAWKIERRYPAEYGKNKIEVSDKELMDEYTEILRTLATGRPAGKDEAPGSGDPGTGKDNIEA